jgi:hypothetical protein
LFNNNNTAIRSLDLFDINDDGELEIIASGTIIYDLDPGGTIILARRGGFVSVFNLTNLDEIANYTTYDHDTIIFNQVQGVDNGSLKEIIVTGWERDEMTDMADKFFRATIDSTNDTTGIVEFYSYYPTSNIKLLDRYETEFNSSLYATSFVDSNHIYTAGSAVNYTNFWIKQIKHSPMITTTSCVPFSENNQTVNVSLSPYFSGSVVAYAKDSCNSASQTTPISFTVN